MKRALVVGLNNYPGNELNFCVNDAKDIEELISVNEDGSRNFDTKLIVDECTKECLQDNIKELFENEADIALLYFSGHGADRNGGYLCTTDNLGISMTDVLDLANNSSCKNRVIILDCCFAAKMGESILVNNNSILGEGVTIIAASQRNQSSVEDNEMRHGVVTDLLIQGLKGGAADIGGNITPASLYSFVDQSLGAWEQRPVFKTNISQFLPIRKVEAKISKDVLRRISHYFKNSKDEIQLDPSYEFTNSPDVEHKIVEPYANEENIKKFKELQLLESVGLVEPVGEAHMYFAAMNFGSCRLTELGKHYWRLSRDNRFY